MNQYEITIVLLLILYAMPIYALWVTHQDREWWRKVWLRDSAELLFWKRNGILRDPLTGRYRKKDKRP